MNAATGTKKKWAILWTATGINFLAGLLYIWSVIGQGLITQYHWTSIQASLPYTLSTVAFVITMVFTGKLQDAKGPRICGILSGALTGAGLILSGFTQDPIVMVLTFGILTGAGVGISNITTTPPALKWFPPEKKGMVTGVVAGGIALASVAYSPLIKYLITDYSISQAFITTGIGAGVLIILLSLFLKNPPAGYTATNRMDAASAPVRPATERDWKGMLKRPDFYKLWIMLAFSSTAGLMIIGHAATIAKVQASWEGGFLLVILLAVFNALGRIAGGAVSDRIGRIALFRIIFIAQAVNMALFTLYGSIFLLCAGVALAGLCYGASFAVFPAVAADLYGLKHFGANYGILFTAWGVGGVIGPMTAAAIFDATHSYSTAYLLACALVAAAAVLGFTFKTRQGRIPATAGKG